MIQAYATMVLIEFKNYFALCIFIADIQIIIGLDSFNLQNEGTVSVKNGDPTTGITPGLPTLTPGFLTTG